jgi:ATP-dependent Clp protease adaptor protein ClpS
MSPVEALPTKEAAVAVKPQPRQQPKTLPPYHVVLLDDNDHSYEYVIRMLQKLFGHSKETAFRMACEVDFTGRVIVDTTSKERAEFKQEQIHAFGPDPLCPQCAGSMTAVIEPAEG